MFKKILGRKKSGNEDDKNHSELVQQISKMDLTEKKSYINNRISSMPVCRDGLVEVLNSLVKLNKKTNTRYLKIDDNDIKIKKGFDLAIAISTHNLITFPIVKSLQEFEEVYQEIIEKFDTNNKQTYKGKLKKAVANAVLTIGVIADIHNSSDLLRMK
ncbi:MAG: hypothetical protein U9N02_03125 [Campylobacterota bacterium]|nr:hypothetical protein [Campylobacterota bacterium]